MITMQNIADKAGVSKGTVSYVLNGKQKKARINQETCEKVIAIAESLGYRRNAIAQSMKTGKTNVIGFIGGLYSSYCMDIIKGINDVTSKENYMLKLLPTENMEQVKNAARQCVEQRLAGIICRSLTEEELEILRKELEPNNIPIVLVDNSFSHNWCSRVISDDFKGAKQATQYLLDLGHFRIGHITNSLKNKGFAKTRCDGYLEIMKTIDGFNAVNSVCEISDPTDLSYEIFNSFRDKVVNYIKSYKPTAIFCGSDPIAMKIFIIASELGLKIPDDISIIGYANLDFSILANPSLTTVRQNFQKMGKKTAEILHKEINGCQKKTQIKLPVKLIIRNSAQAIK